jgi:hypothetical protein
VRHITPSRPHRAADITGDGTGEKNDMERHVEITSEGRSERRKGDSVTTFLQYDLVQSRQREMLREAEIDRLTAAQSQWQISRRDTLLVFLGNALIAAGARIARHAERPRDAAAGLRQL